MGKAKVELIYAESYKSLENARNGIFEYIETFHNRVRRHAALGYVSPHDYEQRHEQLAVPTCGR